MGFFESNPLVFVGAVVLIAEVWIRLRAALFGSLRRDHAIRGDHALPDEGGTPQP